MITYLKNDEDSVLLLMAALSAIIPMLNNSGYDTGQLSEEIAENVREISEQIYCMGKYEKVKHIIEVIISYGT